MLGSKEYPFHSGEGFEKKPSGGIEVHVEKLSKYLARNGHDVIIITRMFPGQKRHEKKGRIQVVRVPFINSTILRTFSFNLLSFFKAIKLARSGRLTAMHCHGQVAGFFGFFLSKLSGRPMVYTPHGIAYLWPTPIRLTLGFFDRIALRGAKKALFISPREKEALATHARSWALLSNGIDFDDYMAAKADGNGTRFIFIGRLVREKGLPLLLDAFSRLQKDETNAELVIAGDGPMRNAVVSFMAANPRLKIRFLGWRRDVPALLSSADAFVLPSQERGQPIALLEAMAAGKTVITSLPYIDDGKTGLSFRAMSVDGLYKKMLYACRNRFECSALGANATQSVQGLSWEVVVKRFISEYQSL